MSSGGEASNPRLTQAAYQAQPGGPLDVDCSLYDRIAAAPRSIEESWVLPIRSGRAWAIKKGQICRITAVEGAQVGDLNLWNLDNPRERMWAARTRQLQRAHVSVYDRLWSTLPYLRPLCTIVGDTLQDYGKKGKQEGKASGSNPGGGRDAEGASVHDLLGTRCDPYVNRMLSGEDFDYHCHSNLVRAVLPHGLHESDVHDVLNVFQATGLNANDQYFMKTCPARRGDYFEFFAEQDLLAALSTCPGGDLSVPMWGEGASGGTPSGDAADTPSNTADPTLACCRPLGVGIFSISAEAKHGWSPPTPNGPLYKGQHGMREQTWQQVAA